MSRHRRQAGSLRVEAAVRYWAYGANLSPAVLARRRLRPLAASPAVLRDHRLLFNHRTGFANVEPANGRSAHGVLYELSDADWLRLQPLELGYRVKRVKVELYGAADAPSRSGGAGRGNGGGEAALTFVSEPDLTIISAHPETLVPVERYARKLREGAAYHGLDREWQGWLGGLETRADTDLPALYLYTPSRRKALAVVGGAALALAAGGWRYAAR